jgi:hypothetical protein
MRSARTWTVVLLILGALGAANPSRVSTFGEPGAQTSGQLCWYTAIGTRAFCALPPR